MKVNFSKSVRRLGMHATLFLAGVFLAPLAGLATDSIYINTGTINNINLPNVDATNFYNSGTWNISTTAPYQTAHTLNFTNVGTMTGSVGWEFDYGPIPVIGGRGMAASFLNDSRGTIQAVDGAIPNPPTYATFLGSYLLISATNVINKGALTAGSAGEMVLTGSNVNLTRSRLLVGTGAGIASQCSFNEYNLSLFLPDTAIYDDFWGQTNTFPLSTTPYTLASSSLWDGTTASSPVFYVNSLCGVSNAAFHMSFGASLADSTNMIPFGAFTNIATTNSSGAPGPTYTLPTQIFRQAVFAAASDANIIPDDRFLADSPNVSNLFQTITVKLTSVLGGSLYLVDRFGSQTNRGVLTNDITNIGNSPLSTCTDPTFRPANYILARSDCQGTFSAGVPGLGPPPTNFLFDSSFSNNVVQAEYAGYGAFVDDLVRNPVGAAITNLPGRIVINATNLDLSKASITSEGAEIAIQADNFIGSTGAVVSCQNLSYNLGSAVGNLNVINLATNSVLPGLNGFLYAWSGKWTNYMLTVITNYATNTTLGGFTLSPITNITEMDFHMFMVYAPLSSTVPITVQDLILHSTNMLVSDSMNVEHSVLFDGQSLTLQGTLNLVGTNVQNWNSTFAPSLLYFTNNGALTIPQNAHFGDDRPTNYAAFVNNGTISVGAGEYINSTYYQSSGSENAPGGYFVTTANGKIENAGIASGQAMAFSGAILKLDNSSLTAGNEFDFNLTNALYDSGGSANNNLACGSGFNMPVKPLAGDLLGTAINSKAFNGAEVDSVWAGQDRGATIAGYSNNVAIGQLTLSPQGSAMFPPLFFFSGASVNNGLYVDLLNLSQITNLEEMVQTDPNIIIYYAAAKLPSAITVLSSNGVPQLEVATNNPLNGQTYYVVANGGSGQVPQEAEEVLNGKLGGHLRWVGSFAGPNSSVDVIINGQTVAVNQAARYSLSLDSNGNGIPNGLDPYPFNTVPVVLTGSLVQTPPPTRKFAITWLAQTNMPYQVQYTLSLVGTNWLPLLSYTNTASTNITVTVWDTNAVSSQRYYRVSHP